MNKYLVQCDFDGTVTEEDISFLMLEHYAIADWHGFDELYQDGKLTVAQFNDKAFGLVRATREELMNFVKGRSQLRAGFREFLLFCQQHHIRFVIVSNGFEFYIKQIFKDTGLASIEYYGGRTTFNGNRIKIEYVGAEGNVLDHGFKDSYTTRFLNEGYRIIYIGDGMSDMSPAQRCYQVFARKSLAERCQKNSIAYTPFTDFHDVIKTINLT